MNEQVGVYLIITLIFLVISLVFVVFIVFHNRKMQEHHARLAELQLAKSKQDLKDSIDIQETERAKIGADLHDELGPTLSAVKLKINSMKSADPAQAGEWTRLREMIDQTISNVRTLSHTLYPNTLREFGLKEAIYELLRRLNALTHVEITAEISDEADQLDFESQLTIYRVIQEFINNALKHSKCSKIFIRLDATNDVFNLSAEDDGQGFAPDSGKKEGLGLKNMRMRAEAINASFYLHSTLGHGTQLNIKRPA